MRSNGIVISQIEANVGAALADIRLRLESAAAVAAVIVAALRSPKTFSEEDAALQLAMPGDAAAQEAIAELVEAHPKAHL